eukprot:scaffold27562_cov106-Isochrysis_galbana.AAC.3
MRAAQHHLGPAPTCVRGSAGSCRGKTSIRTVAALRRTSALATESARHRIGSYSLSRAPSTPRCRFWVWV